MTAGGTRRWIRRWMPATGTCWTTTPPCCPTRGRPVSPTGCTRVRSCGTRAEPTTGPADQSRRDDLRAACRHLYSRGARSTPPIDKLDYLGDLGVDFRRTDAVNSFSGSYGWGYDGVLWYSVHEPYGGPDGLVRLVNACHGAWFGRVDRRGVQPLRPVGQLPAAVRPVPFLGQATRGAKASIIADADSDEVRRYIIGCALRWMRDFHADGLRLDAVHALVDYHRHRHPRGARHRDRPAVKTVGPAAVADRRKRPQTMSG